MGHQGVIGPFWFLGENEKSATVNFEWYVKSLRKIGQPWEDGVEENGACNGSGKMVQYMYHIRQEVLFADCELTLMAAWLEEEQQSLGGKVPDLSPLDCVLWGRINDNSVE